MDLPYYMAQMDYDQLSMELDHGLARTQGEKRSWGVASQLAPKEEKQPASKKRLASTLNALGADKA